MSSRWQPWSREKVAALVTSEIVSLTEADLAALSPFVVALQLLSPAGGPGSDGPSFWLVARDAARGRAVAAAWSATPIP